MKKQIVIDKIIVPEGLHVHPSYFNWHNKHSSVEVFVEGKGSFNVDKGCSDLCFALWQSNIYTTESCEDGYVRLDRKQGLLKELNSYQQKMCLSSLAKEHLTMFHIAKVSEKDHLLYDDLFIIWGVWVERLKHLGLRNRVRWVI